MRISPVQSNNNPNFSAIKSIKCKGLYEMYPRQAKGLVECFKDNEVAMNFCREHDVDIIFNATEESAGILASLKMIFTDPRKSKFLGIFGSNKSSIIILGSAREDEDKFIEEETLLKRATKNVADDICGRGSVIESLSYLIENHHINTHKDLDETVKDTIRQTKKLFDL